MPTCDLFSMRGACCCWLRLLCCIALNSGSCCQWCRKKTFFPVPAHAAACAYVFVAPAACPVICHRVCRLFPLGVATAACRVLVPLPPLPLPRVATAARRPAACSAAPATANTTTTAVATTITCCCLACSAVPDADRALHIHRPHAGAAGLRGSAAAAGRAGCGVRGAARHRVGPVAARGGGAGAAAAGGAAGARQAAAAVWVSGC